MQAGATALQESLAAPDAGSVVICTTSAELSSRRRSTYPRGDPLSAYYGIDTSGAPGSVTGLAAACDSSRQGSVG